MTEPLVTARDLEWETRGKRILGPLDLDLRGGECLAVVGPNGAGKTTLICLLCGVLRPTGGSLAWRRLSYRELAGRHLARRVAYVPQVRPARVPLTVRQLVLLGRYPYLARLRPSPGAEQFAAVGRALRTVGIESLADRLLDELSGGERQAAFVAAALAQETELLLLDEPTAHLDPLHQRDVARLVARLVGEAGRTVVMATHDLNLAALVGDRILALREGVVDVVGAPSQVLTPEILLRVFAAPFEVVRPGNRPVTLLRLGA